ncbi:MAG: endonuclease/exonuclease/phosphatase family protein [Nitrospiraceae bacterium]
MPTTSYSAPSDATSSPDTFKVLTYNTLHGLHVERFWVRPGEMIEQQLARFDLRVDQLAEAQPDLALLQEVNPLPHMAEKYVAALKARDLNYSQVHQVDACGLRVPGVALLKDLNNGLVILAKAPLRVRKLDGLKLSGTGSCHDQVGWQLGELRYALIAEVTSPATQSKYLVSTAHLHSGIERDMYFLHTLMDAHQQGHLMHYDHLMNALKTDQELRLRELHTWINALHRYQEEGPYVGLIIGGDFNFEPGSPEYRELERFGLQDTAEVAHMPMLNTYNPALNPLAGREEEQLPAALDLAIAGESERDREEIVSEYRKNIGQARRIDFLFSMSFMSNACLVQALFGQPSAGGRLAGSDHYGVLNTYSYQRRPC